MRWPGKESKLFLISVLLGHPLPDRQHQTLGFVSSSWANSLESERVPTYHGRRIEMTLSVIKQLKLHFPGQILNEDDRERAGISGDRTGSADILSLSKYSVNLLCLSSFNKLVSILFTPRLDPFGK
jgi:hypothetical protein